MVLLFVPCTPFVPLESPRQLWIVWIVEDYSDALANALMLPEKKMAEIAKSIRSRILYWLLLCLVFCNT